MTLAPFAVEEVAGLVAGGRARPVTWHPGFPTADTVDAAAMLLGAYQAEGRPVPVAPVWWLFGIVLDGVVVGDAGFHGPPADEPVEVEIGYQVVPALRGRGVATRACALLLTYAWEHGADVVRADADPGNIASRAVLRANGFRGTPEDGFEVGRPGGGAAWTG